MWERIVAFFMSIIAFFAGLFGIDIDKSINKLENVSYGTEERQVLDLYIPKENDGEIGLVLLIHGGAWIAGDKSSYTDAVKDLCKTYGVAGATINYRYLSETVTMADIIDDVDAAVQKIKQLGQDNGVNINKMILGGHSAGGHLSMLYAYSQRETAAITPVAVADYCGPTDFLDENFYAYNALGVDTVINLMAWSTGENVTANNISEFEKELKASSPLYYVDENTVPTIISHGKQDTIVPYSNAVSLDKALTDSGVKHDFIIYENSGHGLDKDEDAETRSYELLVEYISEYLA